MQGMELYEGVSVPVECFQILKSVKVVLKRVNMSDIGFHSTELAGCEREKSCVKSGIV